MTYGKEFYEQVYEIVRLIPRGKVTSYGAIAKALGVARSSRMVGYAMNNAHGANPPVPAHRVVNRNGLLTGKHHFGGEAVMEQLLAAEGVKVKNDKIIGFDEIFWDPLQELGL